MKNIDTSFLKCKLTIKVDKEKLDKLTKKLEQIFNEEFHKCLTVEIGKADKE